VTISAVVVGAGPAGFAVAAALLEDVDATITLLDRDARPDALLRHGPAAGDDRLRAVARDVDAVLSDPRVTFLGGIDVGADLPLHELRAACDVVVLATGAPQDLPLTVAGSDSVGVGTVTHVDAWLAGSDDVELSELDLGMDTAVLIGVSNDTVRVAKVLSGTAPDGVAPDIAKRLSENKIRHVQLVDQRPAAEIDVAILQPLPDNIVVHTDLRPVGVVGRNRARALRCLRKPERDGRVISMDLRAQLLLRPRAESYPWAGLDDEIGHIAHDAGRVLTGGSSQSGLYVAGWAGRPVGEKGSHPEDADAVLIAIRNDLPALGGPIRTLGEVLSAHRLQPSEIGDWSAVRATEVLLDRFAGEGTLPLADYDALVAQVDED
jgi:ferredoxin--NADP+ reductase